MTELTYGPCETCRYRKGQDCRRFPPLGRGEGAIQALTDDGMVEWRPIEWPRYAPAIGGCWEWHT